MIAEGSEVPDDENGNPFLTLGDLLTKGISVATLASAIEKHGIYTWDRFGRFGEADDSGEKSALNLLSSQYAWEVDPEREMLEDPRSPMEQRAGQYDNYFEQYGWASTVAPDFDNIRQTQTEAEPKQPAQVRRRAPDAFVAAFVKLAVELAKRDRNLNIDEMPGTKRDLLEVAAKVDANLDHPLSTFDTYIAPLCKFKRGSRTSDYYRKCFPEFFE